MRYSDKLMLVLSIGIACAMIARSVNAQEQFDATKMIIRGFEHRSSTVQTLKGRVLLRYIKSERSREASRKQRANAAADRGMDPSAIPLPEENHLCLCDFAYDIAGSRWRREVVDLTNSGSDWAYTGSLAAPNYGRDMDPSCFYTVSVCDGEKVYEYQRYHNNGWVHYYNLQRLPQELWMIRSRVIATIENTVVDAIERLRHVVEYLGEESMNGIQCLKFRVLPPADTSAVDSKRVVRLWIAPDLTYAAVRQESLTLSPDDTAVNLQVVTADDFVELVPGLWCPRYARADQFCYTDFFLAEKGEGARYSGRRAWAWTKIIQWERPQDEAVSPIGQLASLDMQANVPLDISMPLIIPFDARVNDRTDGSLARQSPSKLVRTRMEDLLPAIEPDPLGLEPPADLVQMFLEGN